MGCYIRYSEVGSGRAHPSAASVPITVLLCGFNVAIKELRQVKTCETIATVVLGERIRRNKLQLFPLVNYEH